MEITLRCQQPCTQATLTQTSSPSESKPVIFYSSSTPDQRLQGSSCCNNSQQAFLHPSDLDMRLLSVCAGGIWTSCGEDFEKETIISCIYHKFQMVYSGITLWKQTVHWWKGRNFAGKFHLNFSACSPANSLMFIIMGLINFLSIVFSQVRFLGSWVFGGCQEVYAPLFSPSQQHMGVLRHRRVRIFYKDFFLRSLNICPGLR